MGPRTSARAENPVSLHINVRIHITIAGLSKHVSDRLQIPTLPETFIAKMQQHFLTDFFLNRR